jgi:predicted nucleotidyltransferase
VIGVEKPDFDERGMIVHQRGPQPIHRHGYPWYPQSVNRDQALRILKESLPQLRTYGVRDVALFGSVARNDADSSSDIDILIDFDPDAESFDNLMNVADLLDARFDSQVDLVTVNGLSPYLAASVQKEAVHAEIA